MAPTNGYAENCMDEVWSFKKTIAKLVLRIPAMSKRFSAEFQEEYKHDIISAKRRITQLSEMIPNIQEVAFYQAMQEPPQEAVSVGVGQHAAAIRHHHQGDHGSLAESRLESHPEGSRGHWAR